MNLPDGFAHAVLLSDRTDLRVVNSIWCTRCGGPCWSLGLAAMMSRNGSTTARSSGPYQHLTLPEALSYALVILAHVADGVDAVLARDALEAAGQETLPLFEP